MGVAPQDIWKEACIYTAKTNSGKASGFTSARVLTHHHKALSSSVSLKHQLIIVHAPVHVRQLYSPDDFSANCTTKRCSCYVMCISAAVGSMEIMNTLIGFHSTVPSFCTIGAKHTTSIHTYIILIFVSICKY